MNESKMKHRRLKINIYWKDEDKETFEILALINKKMFDEGIFINEVVDNIEIVYKTRIDCTTEQLMAA